MDLFVSASTRSHHVALLRHAGLYGPHRIVLGPALELMNAFIPPRATAVKFLLFHLLLDYTERLRRNHLCTSGLADEGLKEMQASRQAGLKNHNAYG